MSFLLKWQSGSRKLLSLLRVIMFVRTYSLEKRNENKVERLRKLRWFGLWPTSHIKAFTRLHFSWYIWLYTILYLWRKSINIISLFYFYINNNKVNLSFVTFVSWVLVTLNSWVLYLLNSCLLSSFDFWVIVNLVSIRPCKPNGKSCTLRFDLVY